MDKIVRIINILYYTLYLEHTYFYWWWLVYFINEANTKTWV